MPILPQLRTKKKREREEKRQRLIKLFLVISRLTGREHIHTHYKCLIWFAEDSELYQKRIVTQGRCKCIQSQPFCGPHIPKDTNSCQEHCPHRAESCQLWDMAEFLLCHKSYTPHHSFQMNIQQFLHFV